MIQRIKTLTPRRRRRNGSLSCKTRCKMENCERIILLKSPANEFCDRCHVDIAYRKQELHDQHARSFLARKNAPKNQDVSGYQALIYKVAKRRR